MAFSAALLSGVNNSQTTSARHSSIGYGRRSWPDRTGSWVGRGRFAHRGWERPAPNALEPFSSAPVLWYYAVDLVAQADEIQDFLGRAVHDLLRGRLLDVDELTMDVGHAANVDDVVRFAEGLVFGVAVGLDVAFVLTQILSLGRSPTWSDRSDRPRSTAWGFRH